MKNKWCSGTDGCLSNCCNGAAHNPVGYDAARQQLEDYRDSIAATYKPDGFSVLDKVLGLGLLFTVFVMGILVGLGLA